MNLLSNTCIVTEVVAVVLDVVVPLIIEDKHSELWYIKCLFCCLFVGHLKLKRLLSSSSSQLSNTSSLNPRWSSALRNRMVMMAMVMVMVISFSQLFNISSLNPHKSSALMMIIIFNFSNVVACHGYPREYWKEAALWLYDEIVEISSWIRFKDLVGWLKGFPVLVERSPTHEKEQKLSCKRKLTKIPITMMVYPARQYPLDNEGRGGWFRWWKIPNREGSKCLKSAKIPNRKVCKPTQPEGWDAWTKSWNTKTHRHHQMLQKRGWRYDSVGNF